ncbi:hypothetical protein [Microcoleus sp. D2_18a_D3]|uniref:hypothetical protein n=1 Tax=Microcoleus sp. D2_18a_D3 TaxID=3055330 RepID=UPI002FD5C671
MNTNLTTAQLIVGKWHGAVSRFRLTGKINRIGWWNCPRECDRLQPEQRKRGHGNAISIPKKERLNCLTIKKKDTALLCPYLCIVGTQHCCVPNRTDIPIRILAV